MSLEIHSKLRRCGPLLLAGVLMVNSLPIGALAANIRDFKDVDGHWAYNALDWAVENGVMTGTSEDTMSPDGFLTRAQMATMIDRLYGAYKGADISAFTDVAMGSWYYDYIAQAVQMGTLAGYDGNIMRPNDHITREQAIVVIARALCLMMEYDEDLSKFSDAGLVGSWAYADICRMVEREFVAGYPNGALGPKDNITRAQMAQILARIFGHIHERDSSRPQKRISLGNKALADSVRMTMGWEGLPAMKVKGVFYSSHRLLLFDLCQAVPVTQKTPVAKIVPLTEYPTFEDVARSLPPQLVALPASNCG